MSDINIFTFTGRLTADPELTMQHNGNKRLNFTVANNTGFGENEHANFFNCAVFGNYAEALEKYIEKGCRVTVTGELNINTVQKNDGTTAKYINVNVRNVYANKASSARKTSSGVTGKTYVPEVHTMGMNDESVQIDEEDLPF